MACMFESWRPEWSQLVNMNKHTNSSMGGVLIERWPRSYWWQLIPWLLSHTRCWPVNISWGLCAAQRAIFKRLGQKRIWEHRPVIQGGTRIIFSTAKIKLGDWAGTEISAATFCARLLCSSHQTFHGMKKKWNKGGRGRQWHRKQWAVCVQIQCKTPKKHVGDMKRQKGCQVDFCAHGDKRMCTRQRHKEHCMTVRRHSHAQIRTFKKRLWPLHTST